MQPISPLPWRDECYRSWIVDAEGQWVAEFSEAEDLSYAVEAANAYPCLREQLRKALEACRWLMAAERLAMAQITKWHELGAARYGACAAKERRALARARQLAREVLGCWGWHEAVLQQADREGRECPG